jgi:hypothetical protein
MEKDASNAVLPPLLFSHTQNPGSHMMSANRSSPLSHALRVLLAAALWVAGIHAAVAGNDAVLDGEVLVKLRSTQALGPLLYKYQLGVLGQFGARPIYRLEVMGQASVKDTISSLLLEIEVLLAEPNAPLLQ